MAQLLLPASAPLAGSALEEALLALEGRLIRWASDSNSYHALLLQGFAARANDASAALRAEISGPGLAIPLEILGDSSLGDLNAAYSSEAPQGGERIYLRAGWLAASSGEQILAVLLEEIGHAIDHRLNGGSDSPGDEGAIFSALLRGEPIRGGAHQEDDQRLLTISGMAVRVEGSVTSAPLVSLATAPAYGAASTNPFGISDVGSSASPAFADADGDGDLDLFIGNLEGITLFFLNTAAPGVADPAYAVASTNPFGISNAGYFASPAFADADADGDLDLFIGNNEGNTLFFLNTAGPGANAPAYAAASTNPFGISDVGYYASPAFADVDTDGDLDLFIGNKDGNTLFFRNTAGHGANTPAYATASTNPFGISNVGPFPSPAFADADADGDLDLFIGNKDGNTLFFRNTAGPAATDPAYSVASANPFGISNAGFFASPAFADADADGDLDLFIGNRNGNTLFFRNAAATPITPVRSSTANGSYGTGAAITLTLKFSKPVFVSTTGGIPTLQLETGTLDRLAAYIGGSGTDTLSFSYTVQAGDSSVALDQLSSNALQLNGGTIRDAAGNNAILTLAAPGAAGSLAANAALVIDGVAPRGSFAGAPAYAAASTNPFGISKVGYQGSPAFADADADGDLDLFIGNFLGNTLFFRNTAGPGATAPAYAAASTNPFGISKDGRYASPAFADADGDGDLDLFIGNHYGNTRFFRNTAGPGATDPAYAAASTNPFGISNVGPFASPAFADADADGDLDLFIGNNAGNTLFFRNTAGPGAAAPAYAAASTNPFGISDVGRSASPAFADADGDGDLDLFISNYHGNTLFFRNTAGPGASAPAYATTSTNPFGISDVGYYASPAFADADGDGDLDLFIGERFGNTLFFRNTRSTPIAPVRSNTANGNYGSGAAIILTLQFSEAVFVSTTGGIPTLQLETGTLDRYASYIGGSGTNTLSFSYTVQAGDSSADLDQLSSNALQLNGGTIRDAAGNNAILTLAAPGALGSLAADADLLIDGIAPTGSLAGSITTDTGQTASISSGGLTNDNTLGLSGTYADANGVTSIEIYDGTTKLGNASFGGGAWSYLTPALADGLHSLSARLIDAVGNSFSTEAITATVDTTAPTLQAGGLRSSAANGSYGSGSVITILVPFSEPVFVSTTGGIPTLQLETGTFDRLASYTGGSGTDTLSFSYIVQTGDSSADLDQLSSNALQLNGGTIRDAAGYNAILTLAAPGAPGSLAANAALVIDSVAPRVSLPTAPAYAAASTNPFGISAVGYFASPAFADVDADGDLDLFIGERSGNTLFFRNTAGPSATAPAYAAAVTNPFGISSVGYFASPDLADVDADGDLDLFIGERLGNTFFFRNTAGPGATAPAYAAAVTNPFGISNVGYFANPAFADVDADGDLDLFIGNKGGNTLFFRNTAGTGAAAPAYAAAVTNPFGISTVRYLAIPDLADVDADGDLDLFIGDYDGNTLFFRNTAGPSATAPAYAAASTNPFGISDVGVSASPAFADVDADGDLDLFIGERSGNTLFFRNNVSPVRSNTANGSYGIGSVITILVPFTEPVFVSTTGGIPTLQLETGTIDRLASYIGGSGTDTLSFSYIVQAGDYSADLDQLSTDALQLNGGTIRDAAGNNAILTLAAPGAPGSLAANAALVIDSVAPRGSLPTAPAYAAASTNPFGISDVGYYASPAFADVDADGDLDLFIGERSGNTLFFRNTAGPSATAPAYAAASTNPFGISDVGYYASPDLADVDADGDLDLLIGEYYGSTLFFRNTAGPGAIAPAYTTASSNTFGISDIGYSASPVFTDADADGDLDLFIGNKVGNTLFFRNTAGPSATAPAYAAASTNPFGISDVGYSASPAFADVDADGDLDLFIGERSGNTLFFRNTAGPSATAPAYAAAVTNPFGISNVGLAARPAFADADADGDLDLFIGNNAGNTLFFRNTRSTPIAPIAPVRSNTANGSYGIGATIILTLQFSEAVFVSTTGGIPTLQLETGTLDRYASYAGGSGTDTLSFSYIVQAGDNSADLDQLSTDALQLNGGTIRDAAGNNAILTLAAPGTLGSLAADAALLIDGIAPNGSLAGSITTDTGQTASISSGGLTNDNTLGLSGTYADANGVTSIEIYDGTTKLGNASFSGGTWSYLTPALADGLHSLSARLRDAASNSFTTEAITATVDTEVPTAAPTYAAASTNPFGISNVGLAASPAFADADADGDLDLFIGEYYGNTLFFRNTAGLGATAPAYAAASSNPFGISNVGLFASPAFADADADGDLDLFIGEAYGNTLFFRNTAGPGATAPAYATASINPFGISDVGYIASPAFADADADGDLDLFIGEYYGNTLFFRNTAGPGATAPAYATASSNPFGISDVGYFASPAFADADTDGDLDFFIGEYYGNTLFFRNTAGPGATAPAYATASSNPFGISDIGYSANPVFTDADADGDLDLFISNHDGNTLFFRNNVSPVRSNTANGSYGIGRVITILVPFSEPVFVSTTGGIPTLQLETGTLDRLASYTGGSGTDTLSFSYIVQAGDSSADLDQISSNALQLNGGTIRDAAGNNAILTLAAPGAPGSLAANADLVIAAANINNSPSGTVTISGTPTQGQTLTAANTLADLDGIPSSGGGAMTYQWKADNTNVTGATGSSLVLTQAEVGKAITVTASYTDNGGTAEAITSAATAVVANINDAPTGAITITGTAAQGQTLTAANALADLDGIPSSGSGAITYQWKADDTTISGATSSTLVLTQAEVGKAITVTASYTDNGGTAEAITSAATAVVANINDAPTGAITITGTASQGQTLAITNSLDDADGLGSFSYQWQADNTNITGATGSSLVLTQAEVGKVISVTASYTDGGGTAEAVTSAATTAVANTNDSPSGSVTISGTPTQGQTLTAANTLADLDGIPSSGGGAITYQWQADGTAISGATGSNLVLTQAEVGKAISVTASYTDNGGTAETVTSARTTAVANINDSPSGSVTISGTPTHGQMLTASNTLADLDGIPSSGSGAIRYQWKANGSAITGATSDTFVLTQAQAGKTITVTASYIDNSGKAEAVTSAATTPVPFTGDDGNNSITGNSADNILDGGAGADTMAGGLGNDTYIVDNINDVVTEAAASGIDTVQSSVTYTLPANVENLTLTGSANIDGTGNQANNSLTGNSANNLLSADAGNDTLNGGAGSDTLDGGDGNDIFIVDTTTDSLLDSSGVDTVWSSVSFSLSPFYFLENLTLTGSAAIDGTGNQANNRLTGNSANNLLSADAGNDTLNGGAGSDTLDGGDGNDILNGGAGNDTLNGGTGADTLTGQGDADIFAFQFGQSISYNFDIITDFTINADKIDLLASGGLAMPRPVAFSRAANNFSTSQSTLISNVFSDTDGFLAGNQALGLNSAALVVATGSSIAGTYLIINDETDGFQATTDLLIKLTGYSGSLPGMGIIDPSAWFV
jgi:hypothetical protein